MNKLSEIKNKIVKDEHGLSNYLNVSVEEMDWLVEQVEKQNSKVDYYEMKLQGLFAIERQLENGELNVFDHSEKVSRFLESVYIKL